ncbi:Hypothetical protein AT6N2_L1920 [Agrobacterium tumefaciens]|nr:Hypothetical protein AT6N2_L1920 [Agrobacterium tumefaciens]
MVVKMTNVPNWIGMAETMSAVLRHPDPERRTDAVIRIARRPVSRRAARVLAGYSSTRHLCNGRSAFRLLCGGTG